MQDDNFSETELHYISEIKRIAGEKGACAELTNLCRKAYNDKSVSAKAYNRIYAICMDISNPR